MQIQIQPTLPAIVPQPQPAGQSRVTTLRKIAMLGNHLPRQCGIATFTTDLNAAIVEEYGALDCSVLAMNDVGRSHSYPTNVHFEIPDTDLASYRRAADFLNLGRIDVLSVQHEYGIYGGEAGSHLFTLLRALRMPIVSTLHTILAQPNPMQRAAMDELTRLSQRLVVMSTQGAELLTRVHGVSSEKIDLIPHGIPALPSATLSKHQLKLDGRPVILTFGLLSPDKGIEHVIDSLPAILARHPETIYIVLGATHPHVKERHGEAYRSMLQRRADELGVSASVLFLNRFVTQEELTQFLSAADIYITPYLNPEQITSGTLAYAVGSGKAVISTPYSYAQELLADGRGVMVPWPKDDPRAIARETIRLFDDEPARADLADRGLAYGRNMRWPEVARAYVDSFERARRDHGARVHTVFRQRTLATRALVLPTLNLDHIEAISDDTGILQHAVFSVPRYEDGYCLDDNARALLLMTLLEEANVEDLTRVRRLSARYLAFVCHAFDSSNGRFRNFMSYARAWAPEIGSEDCHGRALWALGAVVGRTRDIARRSLADTLFHAGLAKVETFTSPRAWAYVLLGIDDYLRSFQGESRVHALRRVLAERLLDLHTRSSDLAWPWFEDRATYANARLPQALLVCGARLHDERMQAVGLRALGWLCDVQRAAGHDYFAPIGSSGFYVRGADKAAYDQQPIEAGATVSACLAAQQVSDAVRWPEEARRAFEWFIGRNQHQYSLYHPPTGACRDGLHADRANENQGAESTLSFQLALAELRAMT